MTERENGGNEMHLHAQDDGSITEGSIEEVVQAFRKLRSEIEWAIEDFCLLSGDRNLALVKLLGAARVQVSRIETWAKSNFVDLIAWPARNLFELSLLTEFVLLSEENLNRFVLESVKDRIDIFEGFAVLARGASLREELDEFKRYVEAWRIGVKEAGYELRERLTTEWMAKALGKEEDYRAFFKLDSKYVHPSSWLVNGDPKEVHQLIVRNIFLVKAQHFAGRIIRLAREARAKAREFGMGGSERTTLLQ